MFLINLKISGAKGEYREWWIEQRNSTSNSWQHTQHGPTLAPLVTLGPPIAPPSEPLDLGPRQTRTRTMCRGCSICPASWATTIPGCLVATFWETAQKICLVSRLPSGFPLATRCIFPILGATALSRPTPPLCRLISRVPARHHPPLYRLT